MTGRLRTTLTGLAILAAPSVFAQPPEQVPAPGPAPKTFFFSTATGGPDHNFTYVASEMRIEGGVIKNAPYSAQAVTETTQKLADGNRISRKSTASLYRDSEGRTRREETLGIAGPPGSGEEPAQSIFINDPVTETSLVLDTRTKVAHKMPPLKFPPPPPPGAEASGGVVIASTAGGAAIGNMGQRVAKLKAEGEFLMGSGAAMITPGMVTSFSDKDAQKESLGTQVIEGVQAEGTRNTMTIPAGAIGNDLPIQIVSERWYSPELHTVVMSKHSDPRMGETVYRLTNIDRNEPARNLFEVPPDYTLAVRK